MIKFEDTNTFVTGVFPDATADNSSGAATPDGFEYIGENLNNAQLGPLQAIMDYSAGSANVPTGAVGVPNGVTDAAGVSQIVEALHKMTGSGPGTVKPWMKEDSPAVTGDRVILLAEQGVLIASYPDLDDATWITGNTAAQIAAEAAGEKFYRSSDAGGATGDAAGPYLQLPPNLPIFQKQYSATGGDFSISGSNWTTIHAVAMPYKMSDAAWRMVLNVSGTFASDVTTTHNLTFSGVTFKNFANSNQSIATSNNIITGLGSDNNFTGLAQSNSSLIVLQTSSAFDKAGNWYFSGDVELDAKPTWADDFEIQWGITY